jgi:hypothetical protein
VTSCLKETTRSFIGEWGYDEIIEGYYFDPDELPDDPAELEQARATAAQALRPAGKFAVLSELGGLRVLTLSRGVSPEDDRLAMQLFADALASYPEDIIAIACRSWAMREKFWPSLSELVKIADPLLAERKWIANALAVVRYPQEAK